MTGQTIPADLINRLAAAIALHLPRRIPFAVDLWSHKEVAEYLKCTPRQVADRYAKIDGFPKPAGPRGMHPRYLAKEVVAWVDGQRERK
jgi:hypothetical protein